MGPSTVGPNQEQGQTNTDQEQEQEQSLMTMSLKKSKGTHKTGDNMYTSAVNVETTTSTRGDLHQRGDGESGVSN
jgi:hypothetical protein